MWPLHEALRAFCVPDVPLFPQWHEIEICCCSVFSQLLGFLSLCNPKFRSDRRPGRHSAKPTYIQIIFIKPLLL